MFMLNLLCDVCLKNKDFSEGVTAEHVKTHMNNTRTLRQPVDVCLWELVAESVWRVKTPHPAASNIQQAASTLRSNPSRLQSCSQAFNKQRKWHITPSHSSEKLHWREKKTPLSSYLTNTSLFEVQTRKNEGLFSGLALHMTAIWGYCVFWPERVVYDRWQERKSRAAGLSTDTQIAFSWLPYSAWYLSSGLQYASLFTARKQLINSTNGGEERELMFFLCWVKVQTPQVVSEHCEIKCILYIASCFSTPKRHNIQKYRCLTIIPKTHTDIGLCWNWICK